MISASRSYIRDVCGPVARKTGFGTVSPTANATRAAFLEPSSARNLANCSAGERGFIGPAQIQRFADNVHLLLRGSVNLIELGVGCDAEQLPSDRQHRYGPPAQSTSLIILNRAKSVAVSGWDAKADPRAIARSICRSEESAAE